MSFSLSISGFNVGANQVTLQYNCLHVLRCGQGVQSELRGAEHAALGATIV